VGAAALIAAATIPSVIAVQIELGIAAIAVYATLGQVWGLPPSFLDGEAAAGGIALVNAIGSLGGFLAPSAIGVLKQTTGDYAGGFMAMSAGLFAAAVIVLALARSLPRMASPHAAE
jgi:ACS family tartrate transporter-like MFS transporter